MRWAVGACPCFQVNTANQEPPQIDRCLNFLKALEPPADPSIDKRILFPFRGVMIMFVVPVINVFTEDEDSRQNGHSSMASPSITTTLSRKGITFVVRTAASMQGRKKLGNQSYFKNSSRRQIEKRMMQLTGMSLREGVAF